MTSLTSLLSSLCICKNCMFSPGSYTVYLLHLMGYVSHIISAGLLNLQKLNKM